MQHNVILIQSHARYYVFSRNIRKSSSTSLIKFNMINQTQIFCGGGQVSDKSKTRDNNTLYSKQIFFIIGYMAHRTCPRCQFRSVHMRRQLATAGGLLWCAACPDRSPITRSALQVRTPYKHTTGSALQSYNYFCTATQFTILNTSNSPLLYDVCKKIHYFTRSFVPEFLRVTATHLPLLLLTPPLLFLSGQGVRNLWGALDVFNLKVVLGQCQSPTSQSVVSAGYRF